MSTYALLLTHYSNRKCKEYKIHLWMAADHADLTHDIFQDGIDYYSTEYTVFYCSWAGVETLYFAVMPSVICI